MFDGNYAAGRDVPELLALCRGTCCERIAGSIEDAVAESEFFAGRTAHCAAAFTLWRRFVQQTTVTLWQWAELQRTRGYTEQQEYDRLLSALRQELSGSNH
jgi:hypothetical protein